ncbi:hypothetical protein UVI_02037860 [Ustilaginoidea virens]|uniref:RNA polymerase II elongator complex subunit n=1 Tax=Ustilaginoidea virens TaxID=1159556 RepID=A0A1B5KT66_USTVR|nr:hypothetical protein UVI_02037860 [Ustilaginoidea virens]
MPLIIVSGLPTSGKSTRAKQLHDYLATRIAETDPPKYRLHLISDDSLSISRAVYDLSPDTDARAAMYGAVKRVLSDRDFVVLDGLNYIKGWRYQLHCEAKAMRTPNCVLRVACPLEQARQDHGDADPTTTTEPYERSNWDNLVFRYEEPNPMTRWDSPLFAILWDDSEAQKTRTFDELWDAMAGEGRRAVKPNQSTVQRGRDAGGDYLYVLERETQDIVKRILDQQSDQGGGQVKVPLHASERQDLVVELPAGTKVGLPQLQRLRRAFVGLNRGGIGLESVGNMASDGMREVFVRYLNDAFDKDES